MSLFLYVVMLIITIGILKIGNVGKTELIFTDGFFSTNPGKLYLTPKISFYILAFFPLWSIMAFRNITVGTDTAGTYYHLFQNAIDGSYGIYADNAEIGYKLLMKFISLLSHNYLSVLIITSTLCWGIYYIYIAKNSENIILSIFVFFLSFNYFHSYNIVRQMLACGIVLIGFKYIYDRQFIKYLLIVLFAMTFHTLAGVFIVFYFLYNIDLDIKKTVIIVVSSLLFFNVVWKYVVEMLVGTKFQYYVETTKYYLSYTIAYIIIPLTLLIIGFIVKRLYKVNDKQYNINMWMMLLGLLVELNAPFIPEHHRLYWIFTINSMIFVSLILKNIRKRGYRYLLFFLICAVYLMDFYRSWITGMNRVQDYMWYWE